MNENAAYDYSEIINLPHHVSPDRPRMSMNDRAAQFAGFSVLDGLEAAMEDAIPDEEQYYYDDGEYRG
ncbi:MAG: hypothetical protein MSJ26_10400 [Oscillospiraceae bacterium]|nr:hypothetical protein [Oscillospiraceae bacterium]